MSGLQQLQREFFANVRNAHATVLPRLDATPQFDARARLGVYVDAYRWRLIDALADSYPALQTLLGEDEFHALGSAYVDAHPSRHFSIRYFGHQLSAFLSATLPYSHLPALAEMAQFEWTLRDVFDAADAPCLTQSHLAQLAPQDWGELRFTAHPALRALRLVWNVPQIWRAIQAEEEAQAPTSDAQPVCWVLWREQLRTLFISLEPDEATALDAALAGANFGQVCEALAESVGPDDAPLKAATYLQSWLSRGWFTT